MNATYLAFAAAVAADRLPGPVVALVVADARRRWPLWTISAVRCRADPDDRRAGDDLPRAGPRPAGARGRADPRRLYLIWLGCDGLCGGGGATTPARRRTTGGPWRWACPIPRTSCSSRLPARLHPAAQPFAPQARSIVIWLVIDLSILLAYSLLSRRLAGEAGSALLDILPNYFLIGLAWCVHPGAVPPAAVTLHPQGNIKTF